MGGSFTSNQAGMVSRTVDKMFEDDLQHCVAYTFLMFEM
jgi:hypothetical protein